MTIHYMTSKKHSKTMVYAKFMTQNNNTAHMFMTKSSDNIARALKQWRAIIESRSGGYKTVAKNEKRVGCKSKPTSDFAKKNKLTLLVKYK